jgi:hypothetical protein
MIDIITILPHIGVVCVIIGTSALLAALAYPVCSEHYHWAGVAFLALGGIMLIAAAHFGAFESTTAATNLTCTWSNTSIADIWVCPKP